MKIVLVLLVLFPCFRVLSQNINLPTYQEGQYEIDTIYSFYGQLNSTGIGSISTSGALHPELVSGVFFKMVVDSTNQGASPTHAAFKDSNGTLVPIFKGDTLDIPASFQIFAGEIGLHVIIEGTPQTASEQYFCDLGYAFTLGSDWEMGIFQNGQAICLVDQMNGISEKREPQIFNISPNPFSNFTTLMLEEKPSETYDCRIYNILGEQVRSIQNLSTKEFIINKDDLSTGAYIFQIRTEDYLIASGKFVIE